MLADRVSKRKHISWKTKCASAVAEVDFLREALGMQRIASYNDAKLMTATQFLSLWQWDHNKLHSFDGGDHFTNLAPEPIMAHRTKTKADAKIIAKSRRIRAKHFKAPLDEYLKLSSFFNKGPQLPKSHPFHAPMKPSRKIKSRGFDKTKNSAVSPLRTGLDGQRQKAGGVSAVAIRPARTVPHVGGIWHDTQYGLRSRGFDKTKTRGFDGKVRKRK